MKTELIRRGFTLIELLVVIAIIAILSASLMPALSSATDRSRVVECRAHLAQVAMALRMYYDDYGRYPDALPRLAPGYIGDDTVLRCTKTGSWYYYASPSVRTPAEATVAACCDPATPPGKRPHHYREGFVALQKSGQLTESR